MAELELLELLAEYKISAFNNTERVTPEYFPRDWDRQGSPAQSVTRSVTSHAPLPFNGLAVCLFVYFSDCHYCHYCLFGLLAELELLAEYNISAFKNTELVSPEYFPRDRDRQGSPAQ